MTRRRAPEAAAAPAPTHAPFERVRGLGADEVWNYENGFYWFADNTRLGKLLAHYELYKRILGLAGDVFELGVYKATSLIRFASFRMLLENNASRRIVAFDAFGAFPSERVAGASDLAFIARFEAAGGTGLSRGEVDALLKRKLLAENVELIEGDVRLTLTRYLETRPAARIALLHLDVDVYEPTKFALETLWSRVVPGGLVVIDDYNAVEGATRAVDEFAATTRVGSIEKLSCSHVPAFIVKQP
jgi:hypothetical protein